MTIFQPFPKLARLSRECVITEKLDGTNAQIIITGDRDGDTYRDFCVASRWVGDVCYDIYAGSRTRLITPGKQKDNFGFAAWVNDNADQLVQLGPGRHFGEWWGKGIQRGYGLDEKRFSLFHTHGIQHKPDCVSVVPVLWAGEFDTARITAVMETLWSEGSIAAPGFMNPEGIVVYHEHAKVLFKKTFDDRHKESVAA